VHGVPSPCFVPQAMGALHCACAECTVCKHQPKVAQQMLAVQSRCCRTRAVRPFPDAMQSCQRCSYACSGYTTAMHCLSLAPADQPVGALQATKRCAGGIVEAIHHFGLA